MDTPHTLESAVCIATRAEGSARHARPHLRWESRGCQTTDFNKSEVRLGLSDSSGRMRTLYCCAEAKRKAVFVIVLYETIKAHAGLLEEDCAVATITGMKMSPNVGIFQ